MPCLFLIWSSDDDDALLLLPQSFGYKQVIILPRYRGRGPGPHLSWEEGQHHIAGDHVGREILLWPFFGKYSVPQRTLADTHVTVREDRKQQKCYRVKDKLFMDEAWTRGEGQDMDVWKSSAGDQI